MDHEIDMAQARLDDVLSLHVATGCDCCDGEVCVTCFEDMPCATRRAALGLPFDSRSHDVVDIDGTFGDPLAARDDSRDRSGRTERAMTLRALERLRHTCAEFASPLPSGSHRTGPVQGCLRCMVEATVERH